MYTHKTGSFYTLYLQNDYNAQKNYADTQAVRSSNEVPLALDKGLDDYLNKIVDAIPELKAAEQQGLGIGVVI